MGLAVAAGSKPKRGTSISVEHSLCANEPGGTCSSFSTVSFLLLHPIHTIGALSFSRPSAPRNSQFGSTMRPCFEPSAHQLAPGGPPARRDFASDTKPPSFFDRRALRAPAHSVCCPDAFHILHHQYLSHSTEPSNSTYHTLVYPAINTPAALSTPMRVPSFPPRAMWHSMGPPHWTSARKVMSRGDSG